jgi:hypothetical protein
LVKVPVQDTVVFKAESCVHPVEVTGADPSLTVVDPVDVVSFRLTVAVSDPDASRTQADESYSPPFTTGTPCAGPAQAASRPAADRSPAPVCGVVDAFFSVQVPRQYQPVVFD